MTLLITNESRSESRVSFELTSGKRSAYVGYSLTTGYVDVCVFNASHRAWGSMGRTFRDFSAALEGYKSPEVKAMIEFLRDSLKPQLRVVA